jgi:hypothetical protein
MLIAAISEGNGHGVNARNVGGTAVDGGPGDGASRKGRAPS